MPGAIVSNSRLYEFDVGNVDLLEGTRITCSVRDPENDNSNSPVVVAMATAIIRNIEGMFLNIICAWLSTLCCVLYYCRSRIHTYSSVV